jgi:hypothetical protein
MFELGKGEEKKILNNAQVDSAFSARCLSRGDNFRYTRCFVKDTLCRFDDRLSSLLKLFLSNSAHCLRRPRSSRLAPHLRLSRVNTDGRGEESAPCHSPQLARQCRNSQMQLLRFCISNQRFRAATHRELFQKWLDALRGHESDLRYGIPLNVKGCQLCRIR